MMLKKIALGLSISLSSLSYADVSAVQKKLAKHYPQVKLSDIQNTEMTGLYSAILDGQLVYINEQAEHLFVGSMIRLKDQRNLTKELAQSSQRIDTQKLPLNDAIKVVKGNGQRQLIIFSDPNCPYCKTLESNIAQLNNVTVYTFLYPLKAQSITLSKQLWCSDHKAYAWQNWMRNNVQPAAAVSCENPIESNLALAKQLKLSGTPALIFENGYVAMGAYPAAEIEKVWRHIDAEKNPKTQP